MNLNKKLVVLLCLIVICCLSFSQNVIIDTTVYVPSGKKQQYKSHFKKTYHENSNIEVTEIVLSLDGWTPKDQMPYKIYFSPNPAKLFYFWYGHMVLDFEKPNLKRSSGIWVTCQSSDKKIITGSSGLKGIFGEVGKTDASVVIMKEIPLLRTAANEIITTSSGSKYLFEAKQDKHKLKVYDVDKDLEFLYNLNCKVNGNNYQPSYTASRADINNIEQKISNLQQVSTMDLNSFSQDFISESVFNFLSSIPTWPDIRSFAVQPNGNKLIVSYKYFNENYGLKELYVWKLSETNPSDINDTKPWTILTGHTSYPWDIFFSRNGNYFASRSDNEGILWEAKTGKKICTFKSSPNEFSPDGELLMTSRTEDIETINAGNNKAQTLNFFSTRDGSLVKSISIPYNGTYFYSMNYAIFGPDGTTYAIFLRPENKLDDRNSMKIVAIKDYSLQLYTLRNKLLDNYGLSVNQGIIIAISKYSSDILEELSKLQSSGPKGEFETTSEYNQRAENSKNEPLKIISKYWVKQFNADKNNNFTSPLDSIGKYNADKKEFPVYFNGAEAKIPIVIEEAKGFKETWWNKAKIEGQIGFFNKTFIPLIQNTTIKRPSDNKVYPVMIKKQAFAEFIKGPLN
jgi:hypothetical protein